MSDVKAGGAYVLIELKDKLTKELDKGEKRFKAWGASITSMGAGIAAAGLGIVTPLALAVKQVTDIGSKFTDLAARTGVGVEALQSFSYAGELVGVTTEEIEVGLKQMQKSLFNTAKGSKDGRKNLERLGLTLKDLSGLKPENQFRLIASRLEKIQDPAIKSGIALETFGKSGTRIAALAEGLGAAEAEARKLGVVMSADQVAAADALGDAITALTASIRGAVNAIGGALAPIVQSFAEWLTPISTSIGKWIKDNQALVVSMGLAGLAAIAVGGAFVALGTVVSSVGVVLGLMKTAVSIVGSSFIALLNPIGGTIIAIAAVGAGIAYFTGYGAQAIDWLGKEFGGLEDSAKAAWSGITDAIAGGDLELAGAIALKGLELLWAEVGQKIMGIWDNVTTTIANTWTDVTTNLGLGIYGVYAVIVDVLGTIAASFDATEAAILTGMSRMWNGAIAMAKEYAIAAQEALGLISTDEAGKQLSELRAKNEAEDKKLVDSLAEDVRKAFAPVGAERDRNVQIMKGMLGDAKTETDARNKSVGDRAAGRERQISDLKKELEGLRVDAAGKSDAAKIKRPGPSKFDPNAIDLSGMQQREGKFGAAGTFNALGAFGIGGSSAMDRTAKATEESAKLLKKISGRDDGPMFGA